MSWVSGWVNSCGSVFFCFIPTLFRDMAKFVHFILQLSPFSSPTFNHTQVLENQFPAVSGSAFAATREHRDADLLLRALGVDLDE